MKQVLSYRSVIVCLALFLLAGCSSPARNAPASTASLDGWRYYLSDHAVDMHDVWNVRDGILICKGEPLGYLYTARPYTNFRLTLDWRWAPGTQPGNSGVLMRINGKPMPLPRSLEAQLKSGDAGDLYGFHGMKLNGPEARLRKVAGHELGGDLTGVAKTATAENPPGQWNSYDILVQGNTIRVHINGKLVNEATEAEIIPGPIGLQSEGGEIHFRNLRIIPLAD